MSEDIEKIMPTVSYLPADLPPLDFKEKLSENFVSEMKYGWWEAVRLFHPNPSFKPTHDWADVANTKYKKLKDYILEYLPFDSFVHAKIMRVVEPAKPHLDFRFPQKYPEVFRLTQSFEPASYRIVLKGKRQGSLFLCKEEESPSENYIFPNLPKETDIYAMPYTNQFHGTLWDPGRLIVVIQGYLNKQLHCDLLERSLKRYDEYAVYRKDLV